MLVLCGASRLRGLGAARAFVSVTLVLFVAMSPALAQDAEPTVSMQGQSFSPVELHVVPGTTVTWTNDSEVGHTVTADDNAYDSGNVEPGDSFSMTFDTPGRYQYYCIPHGSPGLHGMAGVIVVDPDS